MSYNFILYLLCFNIIKIMTVRRFLMYLRLYDLFIDVSDDGLRTGQNM